MHQMKKGLLFTLFVLLVCMITACSGGNEGNDVNENVNNQSSGNTESQTPDVVENDEPVTIKLMHGWTGEVPMAAAFEPAIEKFIADHPEINLQVDTAPGNAIKEKVMTEIAANNAPDVFLHWGTRTTEAYIKGNKVAALDELINNDSEMDGRFIEGAYDLSTYQGKIYGLPMEAFMHYLVVNKALFEENNVKVPETFEELKTAVQTFTDKGLIPFAANQHSARYMLTIWNNQLVDREEAIDAAAGKKEFGDSMLQAAKHIHELAEMKAFPDGLATLSTLQSLELFNAGKSPMYYQHTWTIGNINPDLLDNVAVIPFPKANEASKEMMTANVGYFSYMSQATYDDPAKREAAWTLMKYLAGPEVAKSMVENVSNPSPVVTQYDESKMSPVLKASIDQRDSDEISPNLEEYMSQEASDEFWTLFDRLILDDMTPEEFVVELNKAVTENPNQAMQ